MNKLNAIYLDMDGTIVNTYGVENWLAMLHREETTPYEIAEPLCDMCALREIMRTARENGIIIGVISWGSKGADIAYNRRIKKAKIDWLRRMNILDEIDEIHVVKYGTPKHKTAKIPFSILVDDDDNVRDAWEDFGGLTINPKELDILETLAELIKED